MEKITKLEQSTIPQNFSIMCGTIGWDVALDDGIWWFKTAIAGITDCLNTLKNKSMPVVVMVQDLKGNKIIFACVQFVPADSEEETAAGNWTYFWSWDIDDLPEGAAVYTVDQEQIQKMILQRGYDMCKMTMPTLSFVSQLTVYMFNIIKDSLDQQAVEEGGTWTVEFDGYFEASVGVENGKKSFSFLPKGEMKMLIKDDAGNEK